MLTWTVYYEEYQRRQNLLDEARQYRLIKAVLDIKESRMRKSPFRIQTKQKTNNHVINFEG